MKKTKHTEDKLSKKKMLGISSFVIVLIITFSYYYYSISYNKPVISEEKIVEKSIAVLPFKNLSDDKTSQYFADGVMEDILNRLSSVKEFRVISRTTMEQYRETSKTAPEIAKELNINYLMESSIQKYKDSIRVFTQLIDAENDKHIWVKNFKREFKNIFALESEIAKQVALELKTSLTPKELKKIEKLPTKNLKAYNYYLLGRYFWNKRTIEDYKKSISYYEKAIQEDEVYGLAYAGLSDTYHLLALQGPSENRKEWREQAVKLALKALELDKNLSMPHAVLGDIYCWSDHEWEEAEKEFLKAIELDPNYATAYQYYAELLNVLGRDQETRDNIDKAQELDPLSFVINWRSADIYLHQGNFEKALERNKRCHELIDDHPWLIVQDFNLYYFSGKEKEALNAFKKWVQFDPSEIDVIYQASGFDGLFRMWMERTDDEYLDATLYACLGEDEKALELLELLYEKNKLPIDFSYVNDFEDLRKHPRFIALLKKMNLTE